MIKGTVWGILKAFAVEADYRTQPWFLLLEPNDVAIVEKLRALELGREPETRTPEELKQDAKKKWKASVRNAIDVDKYDFETSRDYLTLENEHWTISSRRNGILKGHEIVIAFEDLKGRTAIFDKNSGLLLSSFDVSFDICYELKYRFPQYFD